MPCFLLLTTLCLILQSSHGYILLTANMEDVQALAKQLAESPVVGQLNKIWRRASSQFQKELGSRRQADTAGVGKDGLEPEEDLRTRRVVQDLVALGRSAGVIPPTKQVTETT